MKFYIYFYRYLFMLLINSQDLAIVSNYVIISNCIRFYKSIEVYYILCVQISLTGFSTIANIVMIVLVFVGLLERDSQLGVRKRK